MAIGSSRPTDVGVLRSIPDNGLRQRDSEFELVKTTIEQKKFANSISEFQELAVVISTVKTQFPKDNDNIFLKNNVINGPRVFKEYIVARGALDIEDPSLANTKDFLKSLSTIQIAGATNDGPDYDRGTIVRIARKNDKFSEFYLVGPVVDKSLGLKRSPVKPFTLDEALKKYKQLPCFQPGAQTQAPLLPGIGYLPSAACENLGDPFLRDRAQRFNLTNHDREELGKLMPNLAVLIINLIIYLRNKGYTGGVQVNGVFDGSFINNGFRTIDLHNRIYEGRAAPSSPHLFGAGVDINLREIPSDSKPSSRKGLKDGKTVLWSEDVKKQWQEIGKYAEENLKYGSDSLYYGGNFKNPITGEQDWVHFEIKNWQSSPQKRPPQQS